MTENRNAAMIFVPPQNNSDIEIKSCGIHYCLPGHEFGPAVRDHFLIHYIIRGEGRFNNYKTNYPIKKGQGFLISPGELTIYKADTNDPWEYIWVGFHGDKCNSLLRKAGITKENPVFSDHSCRQFFTGMTDICQPSDMTAGDANSLRVLGELFRFFSHMSKKNSAESLSGKSFSDQVVEHMINNIGANISISRLAYDFGYNRAYFCELFKKEKGISPNKFLYNYRMERAISLLTTTELKIAHIARSVGYDDPLLFSKQFKKYINASPRNFRKSKQTGEHQL